MQLSKLEQVCRSQQVEYERLTPDTLLLNAFSRHGECFDLFIRDIGEGWIQAGVCFPLEGKDIPQPALLCELIATAAGALMASFDEETNTLNFGGNFRAETLSQDVHEFADFCDSFARMLDEIEEEGTWGVEYVAYYRPIQ